MTQTLCRKSPEELLRMPDEGQGYELVDGLLRELKPSMTASWVAGNIAFALTQLDLGWVFGPGLGYHCFRNPNTVLRADASYISLARMPVESYEDEGHCTTVPDLVAEVVSSNDLSHEVDQKREQWLDAGVKLVWIVQPETKTFRVHNADGGYAFLKQADTLTAEGVLPGFSVPVAKLFKKPGE